MIAVPVGSRWRDMDPRCVGRTFRVDEIVGDIAHCTILTDKVGAVRSRVGQLIRINVGRFTPANYQRIEPT